VTILGVVVQCVTSHETFTARLALVWLLASMNSIVTDQIVLPIEVLVTDLAPVLLFTPIVA